MNRWLLGIVGVLVLLGGGVYLYTHRDLSGSCSGQNPQPHIVAFGDSLVRGYGATTPGGFISMISKSVRMPITNLGKDGDTTHQALARLQDVMDQHPSITIVLLGGNDALQKVPIATTEQNLTTIITQLKGSGSRVILLGVVGGFPDPYSAMFKRIASATNVTYVPNVLSGVIAHPDLLSDAVHPNELGYEKIAEKIAPVLERECGKN